MVGGVRCGGPEDIKRFCLLLLDGDIIGEVTEESDSER